MSDDEETPVTEVAEAQEATTVVAAPAPPPPVNTVEHWAHAAGLLPEVVRGARNPGWGKFRAAKFLHNWPEGAELTEAQFSEAIELAATGVSHG